MSIEERITDALSEFDRVEPSVDLFARVEASLQRDLAHRRRARQLVGAGLASAVAVGAFLWAVTDRGQGTIPGWAVFVTQFVVLVAIVIGLGRVIPRFGQIYVADVFRLDPATPKSFLALQDLAYHLVFAGYVVIGAWHPQMAGVADTIEAMRFVLNRIGGLLLLMGLLHAATLMALPVIGLVYGTIVREHARNLAGHTAPTEDPGAAQAARLGRLIVWIIGGIVVIELLVGLGLLAGLGISGS